MVVLLDHYEHSVEPSRAMMAKYGRELDVILMPTQRMDTRTTVPVNFRIIHRPFGIKEDRKKLMAVPCLAEWLKKCPRVEFVDHGSKQYRKVKIRVRHEGDLMMLRMLK